MEEIYQTKQARKRGYFIIGPNDEGVGHRTQLTAKQQAARKRKRQIAKASRRINRSRA